MNRIDLINLLLQRALGDAYLEIGVRRGETLCRVHSADKTGVDPNPQFDKLAPEFRPALEYAAFFSITSDAFFAANTKTFDVVFIDGLHQYEQVIMDITNAFKVLNFGGFIALHDCCPTDAYSATRDWHEGPWYGDVWKALYLINREYPQIGYAVVPDDCGLGVLWQKKPLPNIVCDPALIDAPFDLYELEKNTFLRLTPAEMLGDALPLPVGKDRGTLLRKFVQALGISRTKGTV